MVSSTAIGPCGKHPEMVCKVMIGFISLSYNLVIYQLEIVSRHFAVALNIPIHNIGIYFDKLNSIRCLFFVLSGLIEYGIFQAAGGDRGDKRGMKVRKYIGPLFFLLLCFVRIAYVCVLFKSPTLSFHVYALLVFEAFFYGFHDSAFMAITAKYISIVTMVMNTGRFFIFFVQSILDIMFMKRPLLMIKIQGCITIIFTFFAVIMWFYFNIKIRAEIEYVEVEEVVIDRGTLLDPILSRLDPLIGPVKEEPVKNGDREKFRKNKSLLDQFSDWLKEKTDDLKMNLRYVNRAGSGHYFDRKNGKKKETEPQPVKITYIDKDKVRVVYHYPGLTHHQAICRRRIGEDGLSAIVSPILMFWFISVFKEFLYPAVLPYALLERDRCHLVNLLIPMFNILGPLTFFAIDNYSDRFICWDWVFDIVWFFFIPVPFIFTFSLMAIHSRLQFVSLIRNSRVRVMALTFTLFFSFGYMNPMSFIGVSKYAFRRNPNGYTIQGINNILAMIARSLFSRIAVGYTDTRISLGYHLPKFRPNHTMSRKNTFWYFFKNTFNTAWKDAKEDFKLNIKNYL